MKNILRFHLRARGLLMYLTRYSSSVALSRKPCLPGGRCGAGLPASSLGTEELQGGLGASLHRKGLSPLGRGSLARARRGQRRCEERSRAEQRALPYAGLPTPGESRGGAGAGGALLPRGTDGSVPPPRKPPGAAVLGPALRGRGVREGGGRKG